MDVQEMVARKESVVAGLRPTLAKGVVWADPENKARTEWVVLFLHGFSSARSELSPMCERLAAELKANCYFGRLPGHGLEENQIGTGVMSLCNPFSMGQEDVTCKGYTLEAIEALVIAQSLGDKVLLVGMSTGAVLSAWMCTQTWLQKSIHACVVFSLNACSKPTTVIKCIGWIPFLRELAFWAVCGGFTERIVPKSEAQAEFRTYVYPQHLLASVLDCSDALALQDPAQCKVPILAFHNPADHVADFDMAERFVAQIPGGKMVQVKPKENEEQHMITGSACAPSTLDFCQREVGAFLHSLK